MSTSSWLPSCTRVRAVAVFCFVVLNIVLYFLATSGYDTTIVEAKTNIFLQLFPPNKTSKIRTYLETNNGNSSSITAVREISTHPLSNNATSKSINVTTKTLIIDASTNASVSSANAATTVHDSASSIKATTIAKPIAAVKSQSDPRDAFLKEPIINPHDFSYVITPNVTCSQRNVRLVICVPISRNNFQGRQLIRDTWGGYAYDKMNEAVLVFFIGSENYGPHGDIYEIQNDIKKESEKFGDILQEDYIDSYNNLSVKSVSILKWVSTFCNNSQFVLKADDDMYVNVPLLMQHLQDRTSKLPQRSTFIIGALNENARVIRDNSSKWHTSVRQFGSNTYPNYVSGSAYAMSTPSVPRLYQAALRTPLFWLEDIYITGLCSKKAGIPVLHDGLFSYWKPHPSGCTFKNKQISGHRYSPQQIARIHKELYDPLLKC